LCAIFLPRNTCRADVSTPVDVSLGKSRCFSDAVGLDQRLLARFLQFLEFCDNVSENTIKAYRSDLIQFLAFTSRSGKTRVTPTRMLAYLSHLKEERRCSETSIKRKLASIKRFFRFLQAFGLSKQFRFPKGGIRFRIHTKLPHVMPLTEVSRLLFAARSRIPSQGYRKYKRIRDEVIISLLFYTGMRIGEVVGLDRTNIDVDSGVVLVHGKGGKDRVLYVRNRLLLTTLGKYVTLRARTRTASEALFVNRAGGRLTSRSVESIFETCLRKAEILGRYTPHSLRHTMATTLLERGTNLRALQEILGHSSIVSTQIYTHVAPQQVEEALTKLGLIKLQ
jgi:integrase/recombinase XerD